MEKTGSSRLGGRRCGEWVDIVLGGRGNYLRRLLMVLYFGGIAKPGCDEKGD
jgi:hypothetical protein